MSSNNNGARERFQKIINPSGSRKATAVSNLSLAVTFSTLTMIFTKLIGFLREILMLQKLSYGYLTDAYVLGFAVPDLFYEILIGGAISAAITPTLAAAIENNEEEKAWKPISIFFSSIAVLMILVVLLGGIFIEPMLQSLFPDKTVITLTAASATGRIIFIQTFFFILIGGITAVLSANKEFVAPNIGNAIYNIGSVVAILLLANPSQRGLEMTVVGIVVSAGAYFAFLFYFAKPNLKYFRFNLDVRDKGFLKLLRIAMPAVVAGTFNQLNFIIQQRFTEGFEGTVTSLGQAKQLYNLPFGIIAAGIGSVVVANLSGFYARRAIREARAFLTSTLRMALYLIVPCAVLFIVANFETVQAVFQWDISKFNHEGAALTGELLAVFSVAMVIMILNYFYTQAFYAMKKSYIALVTGGITLLVNPLMCYIFIRVYDFGLMGVGLAALVYNIVNFIVINLLLRHFEPEFVPRKMLGFGLQLLASAVVSGATLTLFQMLVPASDSKMLQLIIYAVEGIIVVVSYFAASYAFKISESRALVSKFLGRSKGGTAWADAVEEQRKDERN